MPKLNTSDFGRIEIIDPGSDKPLLVVGTLCCAHCGGHWVPKPGSGRIRGWCMNCNGPVCGANCGKECVPVEQMLENTEKGRPLNFTPVMVSVPKVDK
jgi:hypothetical protein